LTNYNYLDFKNEIQTIETKILNNSKKHSTFLLFSFIILLIALIFQSYFFFEREKNLKLNFINKLSELDCQINSSQYRLEFISKGNVYIDKLSSSNLDTVERYIFLNSLWNYSKEFNVNPYIALVQCGKESAFKKNAVSSSGAKGLFQFTNSTWIMCCRALNMPENISKFDIETQCKFYCFYIRLLYDDCKDWQIAITRYNIGHSSVVNSYAALIYKDYLKYFEIER
jgi:hypothetical protein